MLTPHLLGFMFSEVMDLCDPLRRKTAGLAFMNTDYHHEWHVGYRAALQSQLCSEINLEDK